MKGIVQKTKVEGWREGCIVFSSRRRSVVPAWEDMVPRLSFGYRGD